MGRWCQTGCIWKMVSRLDKLSISLKILNLKIINVKKVLYLTTRKNQQLCCNIMEAPVLYCRVFRHSYSKSFYFVPNVEMSGGNRQVGHKPIELSNENIWPCRIMAQRYETGSYIWNKIKRTMEKKVYPQMIRTLRKKESLRRKKSPWKTSPGPK